MSGSVSDNVSFSVHRTLTYLAWWMGAVGSTCWGTVVTRAKDAAISRRNCTHVETSAGGSLGHCESHEDEDIVSAGSVTGYHDTFSCMLLVLHGIEQYEFRNIQELCCKDGTKLREACFAYGNDRSGLSANWDARPQDHNANVIHTHRSHTYLAAPCMRLRSPHACRPIVSMLRQDNDCR